MRWVPGAMAHTALGLSGRTLAMTAHGKMIQQGLGDWLSPEDARTTRSTRATSYLR